MIACKQVAKALAEEDYQAMSPLRRWGLKLHVKLCGMCGQYHRQVMDMQDGARTFRKLEDEDTLSHDPAMPEACRRRLEAAIHDAK